MPFIAISPIAIPLSLNPLRGVLLISLLIFLVLNFFETYCIFNFAKVHLKKGIYEIYTRINIQNAQ